MNERYKILGTIGKEAFEGELYIVKVTKGALWHEEIVTLGKVLALETGDENGSSDRILSASEIIKDADAGTGLAADLED